MLKKIFEVPVVLTSYAYNKEYVVEMEGMIASIKEHHPNWTIVVGRGPVPELGEGSLEVEWNGGRCNWVLPVKLNLDDDRQKNWTKLCFIKAWWLAQVWRNLGDLAEPGRNRVLWLDSDARLGGPIDFDIEPEGEVLAGPWYYDPENSAYDGMKGGILLFQGGRSGKVQAILDDWSNECLRQIQDLPVSDLPWPYSDQDVLGQVLKVHTADDYTLLKLDHNRYCGHMTKYGAARPGTLVMHWLMSALWWRSEDDPDRNLPWPPPEDYRRRVAAESGFPQRTHLADSGGAGEE